LRILSIIGARPQFIKAVMVSRELSGLQEFHESILHTGQHFDDNMSRVFFKELGIPQPDYQLGIHGLAHGAMTGRMLEQIENVTLNEKPDLVIVYGDTNSTLAGALAAVKLQVPVAHVEAGLRSFNRSMPEEINRIVADHCSDLLLAPTETAVRNLRTEGIPDDRIVVVGDVMFDAAIYYGAVAEEKSMILTEMRLDKASFVLATIHRPGNTDNRQRLTDIFNSLVQIAAKLPVVVPLHPRTRQSLSNSSVCLDGLHVIEPVGYMDMVMLERQASIVVTDSGGVQKESYFHRTPCITVRSETEWVELLESGWNTLAEPSELPDKVHAALDLDTSTMEAPSYYGDGNAAKRIIAAIEHFMKEK
jgi:UDP-GlcNAc3NAcA epimerase